MTGPIVNGETFAPGYTREAAEYEQRTRPRLPITVPQAIRLHGYLTEIIARDRHKRDMLVSLRIGLSAEPDLSEGLLASNIADNERLLANLSALLYGEPR